MSEGGPIRKTPGLFRSGQGEFWHWTEDGETAICNPKIKVFEMRKDNDCSNTQFCCKTCQKLRQEGTHGSHVD